MARITPKRIAALIASLAIAGGGLVAFDATRKVDLCARDGRCLAVSKQEFRTIKNHFASMLEAGETLSIQDWQLLAILLDTEIRRGGPAVATGVASEAGLKDTLINVLKR